MMSSAAAPSWRGVSSRLRPRLWTSPNDSVFQIFAAPRRVPAIDALALAVTHPHFRIVHVDAERRIQRDVETALKQSWFAVTGLKVSHLRGIACLRRTAPNLFDSKLTAAATSVRPHSSSSSCSLRSMTFLSGTTLSRPDMIRLSLSKAQRNDGSRIRQVRGSCQRSQSCQASFPYEMDPASQMNKSILYCLLLHDNPRQTLRLLRAIYNRFDQFVLHVDRAAATDYVLLLAAISEAYPNISVLSKRACSWGGFSLVQAEMDMLKAGLQNGHPWTHAVLLSGTHLPAWPIARLRNWLVEGTSFMSWYEFPHREVRPDHPWAGSVWDRFGWSYQEEPGKAHAPWPERQAAGIYLRTWLGNG